jgi:dihydrofolate synthase/folylpolyglutamate synthase
MRKSGADLWLFGRDFNYAGDKQQWNLVAAASVVIRLVTQPARRESVAERDAVLAALESLKERLPVGAQEVRTGLVMVELPGRFQVMPGRPSVVLDVAHNPHAAATLAQNLDNMGFHAYTYAVFGSMLDKDIDGVIAQLKGKVDHWYVTGCLCRALRLLQQLEEKLLPAGC